MALGWNEDIKKELGSCGKNVYIGHNVLINNPQGVHIGDNVRIDPNVMIMCPDVHIGNYVQICAFAFLGGRGSIRMDDWTFIGYHSQLFTASEDYSGHFGPVNDFWGDNKVDVKPIILNRHSGVASRVTLMPGIELPEGS